MTKIIKRICRQCGAILKDVNNECWYCHRKLEYNDILRAEKEMQVNENTESIKTTENMSEESKMNAKINLSFFKDEILYAGGVLMLAGISVGIYQIYFWLKFGNWLELPLNYILYITPESFSDWVYFPTEWIGISNIVRWVLTHSPISIVVFLLGLTILISGEYIKENK